VSSVFVKDAAFALFLLAVGLLGVLGGASTGESVAAVLGLAAVVWALLLLFGIARRRSALSHARTAAFSAPGRRTFRFKESVRLGQTPEQVWAMIVPAEHATFLSTNIVQGFTVPGTPDGLGQRQCFIDVDGNTSMIEVIEYQETRRAVARAISPPQAVETRTVHTVEPLDAGCLLTIGLEFDGAGTAVWPAEHERSWRVSTQDYLDRVRRTLNAETERC
jgi:hypothetical protein